MKVLIYHKAKTQTFKIAKIKNSYPYLLEEQNSGTFEIFFIQSP
jgi:hypothetical protein